MTQTELLDLLRRVADGECRPEAAAELIGRQWSASVSGAEAVELDESVPGVCLDLGRAKRCGFPEVVFGEGKPAESVVAIFERLVSAGQTPLATRVSAEQAAAVRRAFPEAIHDPVARTVRLPRPAGRSVGMVAVVAAGTGDRPVAREAAETLRWMECGVTEIDDVGVAGLHRIVRRVPDLRRADAVVVAAGMEGALPSVVGGLVSVPVIAVPTSVGYGANFAGLAALLSMLNSCAANVVTVNIDAGFKAAFAAGLIAHAVHRRAEEGPRDA
ncbi:MAG: nickel pincer cofactor biosynthesis protein LarB [Planctomycetota bacterium]|nr:MAG: nickel pincer cofactor biosynthesis protein LarB [Planctomycetota bacterium]